jgi:hypothetical protein
MGRRAIGLSQGFPDWDECYLANIDDNHEVIRRSNASFICTWSDAFGWILKGLFYTIIWGFLRNLEWKSLKKGVKRCKKVNLLVGMTVPAPLIYILLILASHERTTKSGAFAVYPTLYKSQIFCVSFDFVEWLHFDWSCVQWKTSEMSPWPIRTRRSIGSIFSNGFNTSNLFIQVEVCLWRENAFKKGSKKWDLSKLVSPDFWWKHSPKERIWLWRR